MSSKMNWKRVKVENLSKRRGWERIDAIDTEPSLPDSASSRLSSGKILSGRISPGRTLTTTAPAPRQVAFGKPHKKTCLLNENKRRQADFHTDPTPAKPFTQSVKKVGLSFNVGNKGAVNVYGAGRFPVTLYYEQWIRLLDKAPELREFLETNKGKLKLKE
jgi:hypothetical protein